MGQDLQILQGAPKVKVGDQVVINMDKGMVKRMQVGHTGWESNMKNYIRKTGKVDCICNDGDVTVKFNGGRFTYNPDIVAKVLSKGDTVKISNDLKRAEYLQKRHGGWDPSMIDILDKAGEVEHVYENYDVSVKTSCGTWCVNPLLCTVLGSDEDCGSDGNILPILENAHKKMHRPFGKVPSGQIVVCMGETMKDIPALHFGVSHGNAKVTKELLKFRLKINETDGDGNTALHIAINNRNDPLQVRLLLIKGAKPNILNKSKLAPIHIAVRSGFRFCVQELLDSSINLEDGYGFTPLGLAIMNEDLITIDKLLSHPDIDLGKINKNGLSALHLAAKHGLAETVIAILEKMPDIVNIQKNDGATALHLAAFHCHVNVVINLIGRENIKLNTKTRSGATPLILATNANNLDIVKLLVSVKADINDQDRSGNTALHLAISRKTATADLLEMDDNELSTTESATMEDTSHIIKLLLNHVNVNVTKTNDDGLSALHMAAKQGYADIVTMILHKKPDAVDIRKKDGFSALHLAAFNGNLGVAKILIQKAKATTDIKTNEGRTPLMLAALRNHVDIVKLLLFEKADVNSQDKDGNTALHLAINCKIRTVELLVMNSASLSIPNKEGKTPLDLTEDDSLKAILWKRSKKSHDLEEEIFCLVCSEIRLPVRFEPCGHLKICVECNSKNEDIKTCMECQEEIFERTLPEKKEKKKYHKMESVFRTGDQVCINMNEALFNDQVEKFKPHMKDLLKQIGTVADTDRNNKVHVRFEGKGYLLPAEMLTKAKVMQIEEL